MTNQTVILWMKNKTGLGSVTITEKYRGNIFRRKTYYSWEVHSRVGLALINEILPYLMVKRPEAELYVEIMKERMRKGKNYKDSQEVQTALYNKIQLIRSEGVG
jgi:hypothetical protein